MPDDITGLQDEFEHRLTLYFASPERRLTIMADCMAKRDHQRAVDAGRLTWWSRISVWLRRRRIPRAQARYSSNLHR